jgi:oligopeptide/dipeptide ABC transporter ATP-binding protein
MSRSEALARAVDRLAAVRIPEADRRARQYPHEFSGGMRQRAMIGMGLMGSPALIVADEPTTALDVTVQQQVLDLLAAIRAAEDVALVLISHDVTVVGEVCDRVLVMYAGQVVETSPTHSLFERPRHPYTHGLLECLPSEHIGERLRPIPGTVPAATEMPSGCRFHPRCQFMQPGRCDTDPVELLETVEARRARCVRVDELSLEGIDS